ncbi:unnamed protein product [Didymodactylos carnosus]|uniref:DJ-1/PfpI domain-containing protein n=1 Tax=Didymodactylos carnosus TaxID=1234261 RepID=A0A813TMD3_9BILA|nr:unnamed protein product [Didymodactylos carnosus]CAF0815023.1 unnamed protein product [Didymodactylos carnosus]CAF3505112.1 unnamed protein product [Didymodactylos carnosus]CAF3601043.1 unnamed protein product [Didymodactylos carnosus]
MCKRDRSLVEIKFDLLENILMSLGKTALLFVANGSEETEVVATVDTLRRGGVNVTICSVETNGTEPVKCAHNVQIVPDKNIKDISGQYDAVIVPGGNDGVKQISSNTKAGEILKDHYKSKKLIAAICAGPIALSKHLDGKDLKMHEITCYPDAESSMQGKVKSILSNSPVVHSSVNDHQIVTSQGPGTAIQFGLKIVALLQGDSKAKTVKEKLIA